MVLLVLAAALEPGLAEPPYPHAPPGCPRASIEAATPLPHGVVSATAFGADPTGVRDSTAALQRAITAARTHNLTIFLPLGCFRVTDTLNATEPRNGRWQPVVVVGQRVAPGARRPTLWLPPRTPGFGDGGGAGKALLSFRCDWCLAPGPAPNKAAEGGGGRFHHCSADGSSFSNDHGYNFNQILQSVDVLLGEGNPQAIGVNMPGAQGSAINDVSVFAAPDALAGVAGGNVGGSFARLTVIGARFGLDMRSSGAPNLVGVSAVNNSCAGVVFDGGSTLTATGLRVEGRPAVAGVVAGHGGFGGWNLPGLNVPAECLAGPGPDEQGGDLRAAAAGAAEWSIRLENEGATSLVDSSIALRGGASVPCVLANSSLYINNGYMSGCSDLVRSARRPPLRAEPGCAVSHVALLGFGRLLPPNSTTNSFDPYHNIATPLLNNYAFPAFIDGERRPSVVEMAPGCAPPPVNLQAKHLWPEIENEATWQTPGATNAVEDCGAKGDGLADDWSALQHCVDEHAVVVLPKGLFRVSQTLVLRRGALVGVGRTLSFLMATTDAPDTGRDWPVLEIAAVDQAAHFGFATLVVWDHQSHVFAAKLRWGAEAGGTWRQAFQNRMHEASFPPFSGLPPAQRAMLPPPRTPTIYGRPLVVVNGSSGGALYDFNLDFGCCFGDYQVPSWENVSWNNTMTPIQPGIASSGEILLQQAGYRTLLVSDSQNVRFYAHNTEQDFGNAHTETLRSQNISYFGTKTEGNNVVHWIRDSDGISVHGHGGNGAAFANDTDFSDPTIWGHPAGGPAYMPSLYRITNSTNVLLANLVDAGRGSGPSYLMSAGFGVDPSRWNMVLRDDSAEPGSCDPDRHANLSRSTRGDACSTTPVFDRPVLWRWA